MKDVLERIRDDNPVTNSSPPRFDDVWLRLKRQADSPRRAGRGNRAVRRIVLVSLAVIPAAAVIAVALVTLGHSRSSPASASGAAGGVLVHYRMRTVETLAASRGRGSAYLVSVDDVWVSGSSAHWLQSRVSSSGGGQLHRRAVYEYATDGRGLEIFLPSTRTSPAGEFLQEPRSNAKPAPCPLVFFCELAAHDPVATLRRLYRRREVKLTARNVRLDGRQVEELTRRDRGSFVEFFVQRTSFIPVEVVVHVGSGPVRSVTSIISGYERLPLTAATRGLLHMGLHPGAPVCSVLRGPGGHLRVSGPTACFFAQSAHPSGAPLPAELVHAFSVFRGLVSEQAKVIPNSIGWEIWVVPEQKQTCFGFASPGNGPFGLAGFGSGGDCVPNSMALAGAFSPATFGRGETVIGLAPNGNRTVKLRLSNGSMKTVPVSNNVYEVHTSRLIQTVTLKDSTGKLKTWNVPDGGPK